MTLHQTVLHTHIKQSKLKFRVCTPYVKHAFFGGNGGQMPSGQEITLSCSLGDSHKTERAVLGRILLVSFFPLRHLDTWRQICTVLRQC
jgi:hypothetical protein